MSLVRSWRHGWLGLWLGLTASGAPALASAETYHVDFEGGSDAADGLTADSAWQHCPGDPNASDQAAAVALAAGDVVRFRGGVAYRGSITVEWDGQDGSPIVYDGNADGTYGDGRALLEGSEPLGGWAPCASADACGGNPNWQNLYTTFTPSGISPFIANLCEGTEMLAFAQEPDQPDPFFFDAIDNFFTIPPAQITRTTIVDPIALDQSDPAHWDDSFVLIWRQPNLVSLRKITAFEPAEHRITFDDMDGDPYDDRDNHYSIYNSIHALDQPGEYFVSDTPEPDGTHQVILWPHEPSSLDQGLVTVSVRAFGFNLAGHSYVTIQGFAMRRFSDDQLTTGVGIGTVNRRDPITGVTVRDNEVRQVRNPTGGYGGIFVDACAGCLVEDNLVEEAFKSRGIFVPGAVGTTVRNNRIHKAGSTSLTCYGCTDTELVGNVITDGTGTHANGITVYLGSENIRIVGNRVVNANISFTMQESRDLFLANNVFYGGGAGYLVADWGSMSGTIELVHNTILNSSNDAAVLFGDSADRYVLRNNILDGGGGGERSHNIYTSLTWNQDEAHGWQLAAGEAVVEDLATLFVDPEGLDFHLRPGSPAVDTGTDVGVTSDLDGLPRPGGAGFDIGAYEYYDGPPSAESPTTADESGCGCRLAQPRPHPRGWWLLAVAMGWITRRLLREGAGCLGFMLATRT